MKPKIILITLSIAAGLAAPALGVAAADQTAESKQEQVVINMFGGPSYHGEPALAVTAALVEAGGGADNFSFAEALVAMLGEETVNAEVAKLISQYGEAEVNTFIAGMDLAIGYSLDRATNAGVSLPEPAKLTGIELARALVNAGIARDGTFWSGYLFDKAVSHQIHNQVMLDINASAGYDADRTTHKILNQAMYDVAQALGMDRVKLAELH